MNHQGLLGEEVEKEQEVYSQSGILKRTVVVVVVTMAVEES